MINIVDNNEIYISPDDWVVLNQTISKVEIKQLISDAIKSHNIPLPMRDIAESDAHEAFQRLLNVDTSPLLIDSPWITRYEYSDAFPFTDKVIKSNSIGNIASDFFQQTARWKCDSINAPSPYRTWNTEKFRLTLLNGLWSLKVPHVDTRTLRSLIGLRKYIASQFRPSAAKTIYEHFNAKHVLDFSSGWGDRLCGFLASPNTESYTGIDPNKTLIDGYEKQIQLFNTNKQVSMISDIAENSSIYPNRTYDMVFTSPPYFNIERYTQETNQSFKKYKKIDVWLNEFLYVALENSWNHLNSGGHLIINISDVYSNHTINKICDPMNTFISTLSGASYVGCWGYEMRKRPNSGALKNKVGVFAEPVWIWRKS
jgi:16S rRNA G966 N2-methylase RsmD